ncbi:beta-taxilin-like [Tubulanus polymorphus]|uniref:beta-taxilin-like n=1 Tax=Tubulanus polymorphus TaxID=672921 RepID=UPI003DA5B596
MISKCEYTLYFVSYMWSTIKRVFWGDTKPEENISLAEMNTCEVTTMPSLQPKAVEEKVTMENETVEESPNLVNDQDNGSTVTVKSETDVPAQSEIPEQSTEIKIPAITPSTTDESSSSRENSEEPKPEEKASDVAPVQAAVAKETKPEPKTKKTIKKDLKAKKKEDKGIEHVLKALSSLNTPEEKLAALCKKYTDLLEDHRLNQASHKQGQRSLQVLMREKDQLQTEHTKALLAKSKMENLCRELQKHNKLIKEESVARAKIEEEKRKDVTNKFQSTINDIQSQMNDHYTNNSRLKEENVELAQKLKKLIEQYEKTEKHMDKLFKTNKALTEEKEGSLKEKHKLLLELQHSATKIAAMEATEAQLNKQLSIYTEKYEDFQSTLKKSNEVFNGFKSEMDKMTKKIKKLEKDTTMWKTRWEQSNKALIDMVEEKTQSEKQINTLQLKVTKLEKLCRALQAERNSKSGSTSPKSTSPEPAEVKPVENGAGHTDPQPSTLTVDEQEQPPAEETVSRDELQNAEQPESNPKQEPIDVQVEDDALPSLNDTSEAVQSEPVDQ